MSSKEEASSNVSRILYEKTLIAFAERVMRFDHLIDDYAQSDRWLKSISIRFANNDDEEHLAVLRAEVDGQSMVCFHSGETVQEVLRGLLARLENKSIKWKEDQYESGS